MAARPRARRAFGVSCCVSRASVPGLRACGSFRSPVPSPVPSVRAGGGGGPGLPSPSPGPPSPCPPPALRFSSRRQYSIQSLHVVSHQPFVSIVKVVLSSTVCPPFSCSRAVAVASGSPRCAAECPPRSAPSRAPLGLLSAFGLPVSLFFHLRAVARGRLRFRCAENAQPFPGRPCPLLGFYQQVGSLMLPLFLF